MLDIAGEKVRETFERVVSRVYFPHKLLHVSHHFARRLSQRVCRRALAILPANPVTDERETRETGSQIIVQIPRQTMAFLDQLQPATFREAFRLCASSMQLKNAAHKDQD